MTLILRAVKSARRAAVSSLIAASLLFSSKPTFALEPATTLFIISSALKVIDYALGYFDTQTDLDAVTIQQNKKLLIEIHERLGVIEGALNTLIENDKKLQEAIIISGGIQADIDKATHLFAVMKTLKQSYRVEQKEQLPIAFLQGELHALKLAVNEMMEADDLHAIPMIAGMQMFLYAIYVVETCDPDNLDLTDACSGIIPITEDLLRANLDSPMEDYIERLREILDENDPKKKSLAYRAKVLDATLSKKRDDFLKSGFRVTKSIFSRQSLLSDLASYDIERILGGLIKEEKIQNKICYDFKEIVDSTRDWMKDGDRPFEIDAAELFAYQSVLQIVKNSLNHLEYGTFSANPNNLKLQKDEEMVPELYISHFDGMLSRIEKAARQTNETSFCWYQPPVEHIITPNLPWGCIRGGICVPI